MELKPVVPFEPVRTDTIPNGEKWVYQVKWDGVRMLTYYDGNEIRLINRKGNERTLQYPEYTDIRSYCTAESVILDGEIIALEGGKPSFHRVMSRDGIRKREELAKARQRIPVTYLIFDVLYLNGGWVIEDPLIRRQELLREIIRPRHDLQLVEDFKDGAALFEAVRAAGMEGIVCKDLNSTYLVGGKDKRWQKKKNYRDITAVIGGATFRGDTVNAVLLGQYNERDELIYIGRAGTGRLSHQDWKDLTLIIKPLEVSECPFNGVPSSMKGVLWVKPRLVVMVRFIQWTGSGTLRQPSIQGLVDVPPEECTLGGERN